MCRESTEFHGGSGRAQVRRGWQLALLLVLAVLPVVLTKTIPSLRAPHDGGKRTGKEEGAKKLSFHEEMIAGALARAAAQCVMYPADVLKTLAQTRRSLGAAPTLSSIPKAQLLKGSLTTSALALPAGAIQFSVFRLLKDEGREIAPSWISTASIELTAAAVAAVAACIVQTPQEVIKQRMQAGIYPSFMQGVASLLRSEGARGFYTGFLPTVARNTPTVCISFTGFARLKVIFDEIFDRKPTATENLFLGGISATIATLLTQPVDVVKTRLMTQAASSEAPYTGIVDCVNSMLRTEGIRSFFRGLLPRLLYVAPFAAVQFAVNEQIRSLLLSFRESGGNKMEL